MSRSNDAPTPDEMALIEAQRQRTDVDTTIGNQTELTAALRAPAHFAFRAMQRIGVLPTRPPLDEQVLTMPDSLFGYAIAVAELRLAEDEQQVEFDVAVHVTHDRRLLDRADDLEAATGIRPVTIQEMARRVDALAAARKDHTSD